MDNMNSSRGLQLNRKLVEQVDAFEKKLLDRYGEHIACSAGCSQCCILQSVFPVEAFVIYEFLKGVEVPVKGISAGGETCPFLKEGLCTVYPVRPLICRTHGYPILTDEGVDFCPLNFRELDSIDSEYILSLENLNSSLAAVNMLFMENCEDPFFQKERVSLAEIIERVREEKNQ